MILVILLPSLAMMIIRPHYIKGQGNSEPNFNTSSFMSTLVQSNYVLYAEEKQRENQAAMIPFDIFFPSAINDKQTKENEEDKNSGSKSNYFLPGNFKAIPGRREFPLFKVQEQLRR